LERKSVGGRGGERERRSERRERGREGEREEGRGITRRVLLNRLQVGKNEIIATERINFNEVQQGKYSAPFWINLYGSPYPEV
jgi:hypothetical protein